MKRPAYQFYPGDWQRDSGLRSCSLAARGLWQEMLCIMHDGQPYGHLQVGRKRLDDPHVLCAMIGSTSDECVRLLGELEEAEVFSKTRLGVIFSRRMVRDEALREKRTSAGKLGGNPALLNHKDNPKSKICPKQNLTPASASASAEEDIEPAALVVSPPAKPPRPPPPEVSPEEIVDAYRRVCVPRGAPDVREITGKRLAKLRLRIREHSAFDWWNQLFNAMASSPFLFGNGDRGWKASLDWLIENDTNAVKITEGRYSDEHRQAGIRR